MTANTVEGEEKEKEQARSFVTIEEERSRERKSENCCDNRKVGGEE